jgi:hypothetical protein
LSRRTRPFHADDPGGGGEDVAFFADVRALGFKVWLDATINLGHVGAKVYREAAI